MGKIKFTDNNGTFVVENPENYSGLYLPLASEKGLKSSITPTLAGDSKTDQNHFLFEPVSIENLHNNKNGRNFWCRINNKDIWSVSCVSAMQDAEKFFRNGMIEELSMQGKTNLFVISDEKKYTDEYGLMLEIEEGEGIFF